MRRGVLSPALALGLALAGCGSNGLQPDVPAVRTSLTEASTLEIEQIVATAAGGSRTAISGDALSDSSLLVVERAPRQRVDVPSADGRNYGRPDRFRLVLDGPQCFLVHEETGLRYLLKDTVCIAE
jgi:hypothetical protein